jgi:serine/threonine-protein kinase
MDDEGRVVPKVLDFGIADLEWETNSKPTLAGTPAYMAPEQLSLGIADHRVDVWAISVVLYEMISGRTPVAASVVSHVPTRVGSAREDVFDPPTLLGRFDVDDELWAILGRGLRSAATRYTSMREIGEALARWLIERGVTEGLDGVSLASKWPEEGPRCERPAAPAAGWVGRTSASFTPGQLVSPTDNGRAITFVRSRARERRRFASVIVGATLALGASGWAIHASVDPTSVESRGAVFSATRTSAAPMEVDSTPVSPPEAPPATSVRAPIVRAAASTPPATRGARAPSAKPYALPPRASSAAPSAAPTTIASSAPSTAPEDIPYLDALVTDRPVTDPLGRPRGF